MIQTILDRLPTQAGRWKVTHSDSSVEYVTVERADEPSVAGTSFNRALFSNLQGDLYTFDRSVTPDSATVLGGTTVNFTSNKTLTSYETGKLLRLRCPTVNGTWNNTINPITWSQLGLVNITASSTDSGSNVYNAIDGIPTSYWNNADTEYQNVWLKFQFKSAITIKKMKTRVTASGSTGFFASGKLQGSNNNSTWVDLYTFSAQSEIAEITLTTTGSYKYYRILASATTSTRSIQIYEVEVTEYEGANYALYMPQININSLGAKVINGTLYADRDYLLRYSSGQWNIVEGLTNFVTGTLGVIRDTSITVAVGFKPKLVILYSARNNASGVAIANNSPYQYHIPIIITDQCSSGKVALTSSGFTINESANLSENTLYYIAIG